MALTPNLQLHYYGGDIPGSITDNGGQHTGADRLYLDQVITQLAAGTRHYQSAGNVAVSDPQLSISASGGTLPGGTMLCYRIALVGLDGFERAASNEVRAFTPAILLAPDVPGLRDAPGSLPAGLYYYALTAKAGDQESILSAPATVNVFPDGISTGGMYVDAPDDDQDVPLQVWRRKDSDAGWTRVGMVEAQQSFLDDGSIPADPLAALNPPPTNNRGVATASCSITLAGEAASAAQAGQLKSWRIYRSTISGFYSAQSLVHEVIEHVNDDGSDEGPLRTTFIDTGDALATGTPQLKDRSLAIAPYGFEVVTALPTNPTLYPAGYPLLLGGVLYTQQNGNWVASVGGGGTTVTYGAALPSTLGRAAGDLHLLTGDGSFAALIAGTWTIVYAPKPGGSGSPILTSPTGRRFRTLVADDGTLATIPTLEPGPPAAPTNPALED